jgi:hypothetical protein
MRYVPNRRLQRIERLFRVLQKGDVLPQESDGALRARGSPRCFAVHGRPRGRRLPAWGRRLRHCRDKCFGSLLAGCERALRESGRRSAGRPFGLTAPTDTLPQLHTETKVFSPGATGAERGQEISRGARRNGGETDFQETASDSEPGSYHDVWPYTDGRPVAEGEIQAHGRRGDRPPRRC